MLKPTGFCVLVRPDSAKDALKTERIEIPDSVLDKQRLEVDTGELVAVSKFAWTGISGTNEPWANVGDRVVYAKYGGKLMTDPETGEKLMLLNDKDIIGVL